MIIANTFSLNMLPPNIGHKGVVISATPLSMEDARQVVASAESLYSCVGHADTAALFTHLLGRQIDYNRATIALTPGSELLVGQYVGPRLPEGCTELPKDATVLWWLVRVLDSA